MSYSRILPKRMETLYYQNCIQVPQNYSYHNQLIRQCLPYRTVCTVTVAASNHSPCITVITHFNAKHDEERTVVAFGLPVQILDSKMFFTACRDPQKPTKIIKLKTANSSKLVYQNKTSSEAALEKGYITIYNSRYRIVRPRISTSNLCHNCKTLTCTRKNKCGLVRCGNCGDPHATSSCTIAKGDTQTCVVCGNEGHVFLKCPQVEYTLNQQATMEGTNSNFQ